jgi:dihydropteroate synthase
MLFARVLLSLAAHPPLPTAHFFLTSCLLTMSCCVWRAAGREVVSGRRPRVMGVLNVTPDSFSDGGQTLELSAAVARAEQLVAEGADLLDIGGESSRPGAEPVALAEELRRVVPVVEAVAQRVAVPISVDTTKAEVARRAIAAGATIINDISALTADSDMARVVAESGAGVILMHMQGTPQTMQLEPRYADVLAEVLAFLQERIAWAEAQGIPRERIAVDPGIGFGKTSAHNLDLLRNLERFATLGCAVVIGTSRKGFLGKLTGRSLAERVNATVVSNLAAAAKGARVLRVHDVATMVDALRVWEAVYGWDPS